MSEKTVDDPDKPLGGQDGHRRFKESVNTKQTPQEERDEKRETGERRPGYGQTK
ncbi:MAG: hypothetical protein ACK4N1_01050 [Pseudorhizobium sp.]